MTASPSARPSAWTIAMAAAILLVVVAAILLPIRFTAYTVDAMRVLEGGLRMESGLRIHQDFFTPLGAPYIGSLALGVAVVGSSFDAFKVAFVVWLIPTLALGAFTLPPRLGPKASGALLLAITLLMAAPTCIGDPQSPIGIAVVSSTYGMQYNRFLWGLAAVVVVALALPRRSSGRIGAEHAALGAAIAVMGLTKLNFLVGLTPILVVAALRPEDRTPRLVGLVTGVLGLLAVASVAGLNLPSYAEELRRLAGSQTGGARGMIGPLIVKARASFPLIAATLGIAFWAWRSDPTRRWPLAGACAALASGALIVTPNYQAAEVVLYPVAAIIAAFGSAASRSVQVAAAGLLSLFTLPSLGGLAFPYLAAVRGEASSSGVAGTALFKGVRVVPGGSGEDQAVNMAELARKMAGAVGTPARARFLNGGQVALVLGWPAPGGTLWFDEPHTISAKTARSPQVEFRHVDVVAFEESPRSPGFGDRMYRRAVEEQFPVVISRREGFVFRTRVARTTTNSVIP